MSCEDILLEKINHVFDAKRMASLIDDFARIGADEKGGVTRLAFSPEDLEARRAFIGIVESELNLAVRMDSVGNLFARRAGKNLEKPVIMAGSHLDSVRNGGKFDGPAGVFCALEAFRALDQLGIETEHPFELVVFCSEEPNPFGISTFGSRGMAGKLDRSQLESLTDEYGKDFRSALEFLGGSLDRLQEARVDPDSIAYLVELHIEQMPYLERQRRDIGVVAGVTGIYREHLHLQGEASHCGTTPMNARRDALCAASQLVLAIEAAAAKEDGKAVATVGRMSVFPNSMNITPAQVEMDVEIRSYFSESIERIKEDIVETCRTIDKERSVKIQRSVLYQTPPTPFSPTVREAIGAAAKSLGLSTLEEISMAGHDAAHMATITDAGMIFIPCRGGISHCPQEYTDTSDLVKGAQTLLLTLLMLDRKGV